MSRTFSIVCHETKQSLWIGQSETSGRAMAVVQSLHECKMRRLGRFLIATQGKPLMVVDDEGLDYAEFEETEKDFE